MRVQDLLTTFNRWDERGFWAYTATTLKLLFPGNDRARAKALAAHQAHGLVARIARGLYINPHAQSLPADLLSALVPWLRPWDLNYLSLESVLSESGLLSQIPSRLTLITTGRSQVFDTPYGTIEFTHTTQAPDKLQPNLSWQAARTLWVATPEQAWRDLRRSRRNLDLIDPTFVARVG